jgi:uncharacterized protein YdhG (YjbR/CyaY superfamily)
VLLRIRRVLLGGGDGADDGGDEVDVFGVSAAENHLALAPWSSRVIEEFRESLEGQGYLVRKNLFHVPNDWEIDRKPITGLIRVGLTEMDRNSSP